MGRTAVGADVRVEFIFRKIFWIQSYCLARAGQTNKQTKKENKEIDFHVYVKPKQHAADVVHHHHHLHHRGPMLVSMVAFTGPAAAVNALHFIYQ